MIGLRLRAESFTGTMGGTVLFKAYRPHGRGQQTIEIAVPYEDIERIANALRQLPRQHGAHAIWHVTNDRPIPCDSCRSIATPEAPTAEGTTRC